MLGDSDPGSRRSHQRADRHQSRGCGHTRAPDGSDPDPRIRITAGTASPKARRRTITMSRRRRSSGAIADTSNETGTRDATSRSHPANGRSALQRLLIRCCSDRCRNGRRSHAERARRGTGDFVFVPTLVGALRHRRLKGRHARCSSATASGDRRPRALHARSGRDIWVRRHIPATLRSFPLRSQRRPGSRPRRVR